MGDLKKKLRKKQSRHQRARWRVRSRIDGTAARPRLACHKSLRYIYVQAIDDSTGTTLAQASSMEKDLQEKLAGKTGNAAAARLVGETVAERLKEKGVTNVVFDRGGFIYHGKVKALADGARAGGLEF